MWTDGSENRGLPDSARRIAVGTWCARYEDRPRLGCTALACKHDLRLIASSNSSPRPWQSTEYASRFREELVSIGPCTHIVWIYVWIM